MKKGMIKYKNLKTTATLY